MTKRTIFALLLFISYNGATSAEDNVGMQEIHLQNAENNNQNLSGFIWYPTQARSNILLFADNRLFYGIPVIQDAPIEPGRHPLILLSHGLGGNGRNQAWLAAELVHRGMIVFAINHPGSSTGNVSAATALEIWRRPADISTALSVLTEASLFSPHIDQAKIGTIGYSLGGYTSLALAGAQLDGKAFKLYCETHSANSACVYFGSAIPKAISDIRFEQSFSDRRIAAIVALAPGFASTFQPASLAGIRIPALIITGREDNAVPVEAVRDTVSKLPNPEYMELDKVGHFDFLPVCKPGGAALLQAEKDDPICDGAVDRAMLHKTVAQRTADFLNRAFSEKPPINNPTK